ncbi:hypothetical protein Tco_0789559 [Tanacetum coccineum]
MSPHNLPTQKRKKSEGIGKEILPQGSMCKIGNVFFEISYNLSALNVSLLFDHIRLNSFGVAKSKQSNNVRHITAKVAGKAVSISEASIRTDLIFDDADGIDSLPNQAIFNAIQLMGYEGDLIRANISAGAKVTPLFVNNIVESNHNQDVGASQKDYLLNILHVSFLPLSLPISDFTNHFQPTPIVLIFNPMNLWFRSDQGKSNFLKAKESQSSMKQAKTSKGKKKIEEEDESFEREDVDILKWNNSNSLKSDEEMARKIQKMWAEKKRKRQCFLHDTIAAQRKFLARQRSEAIRNKTPTKNQLRNQMMTYLKHVGNFKHSELKSKKFEDIQAMYEKKDFSKMKEIKKELKLNVQGRGIKENEDTNDPSDTEKENDELRLCLTIAQNEDMEVEYEIIDRKEDLDVVYKLVMDIYQDKIPEGFDKVLWEIDCMFIQDEQDEFWNSLHEWKVVSWKLHSSSGVHTLMTEEGLVVHMLTEKKYPLKKEIVMQMLKIKLESEEESTMALELIRFIKKVLADLESKE